MFLCNCYSQFIVTVIDTGISNATTVTLLLICFFVYPAFFQRLFKVRPGPQRSLKEEPLGIDGTRFFCKSDALPVIQPTASEH